jgi:multidrug efflux system membrane fusion protein
VLTQVHPIAVIFSLPQDQLPEVQAKIRAGASLEVDAYDRDNSKQVATGKLLTTDNQIDTTTGTYKLKASFDNEDDALFPNQFVNVRLRLDTRQGLVLVPSAAIQRGSQGTFVYVVGPDQLAHVQVVTVALSEGDDSGTSDGLKVGDNVVVDGQDKLQEGSKVDLGGKDQAADGKAAGAPAGGKAKAGRKK